VWGASILRCGAYTTLGALERAKRGGDVGFHRDEIPQVAGCIARGDGALDGSVQALKDVLQDVLGAAQQRRPVLWGHI
jgi:hypothetical protein